MSTDNNAGFLGREAGKLQNYIFDLNVLGLKGIDSDISIKRHDFFDVMASEKVMAGIKKCIARFGKFLQVCQNFIRGDHAGFDRLADCSDTLGE